MSQAHSVLCGAQYVLGEEVRDHKDIKNFAQSIETFQMINDPKLWSWGHYRKTGKELNEIAIEAGRLSMNAAAMPAEDIDAVILCSTRFPGGADVHAGFTKSILEALDLPNVFSFGLTLNRCTTLLSAIHLADLLVRSATYRTVLIITTDKIHDETVRMEKFAIFSDAAAACLVVCNRSEGFQILGTASVTETATMSWGNEISSRLGRQVNDILLSRQGLDLGRITKLFHNNLFKPIVAMKEQQVGFRPHQLFPDNIARIGHCFAADPLINLVDHEAMQPLTSGDHVMLASSVPGGRTAALLRKA